PIKTRASSKVAKTHLPLFESVVSYPRAEAPNPILDGFAGPPEPFGHRTDIAVFLEKQLRQLPHFWCKRGPDVSDGQPRFDGVFWRGERRFERRSLVLIATCFTE